MLFCPSSSSSQVSNKYRPVYASQAQAPSLAVLFCLGLTQAIMNRPLPAPPKRFDLVESFDALALAGKKTHWGEAPRSAWAYQSTRPSEYFVGGLSPELLALNAALDSHCRQALVPTPSTVNQNARTVAQAEAKAPRGRLRNRYPCLYRCTSLRQAILDDGVRPRVPETRYPNETRSFSALCYRCSTTTFRFCCVTQSGIEPPLRIRTE